MSLKKRHIGRRVAGVGVGVALLVLGLEAPAMAAPAVTGVSPTTGPTQCVIVLTGTGFTDVTQVQQTVTFSASGFPDVVLHGNVAAEAALFARNGSTEMWVQAPATLALGVGYTIKVSDPSGGTASTGTFTRVATAGGCAPTITSLTPACGNTGDAVVIAGTNLIGPGLVGAATRFAPYLVDAAHVVPDVDVPTSISVVVPSASSDGKVQVTTFTSVSGGLALSPTVFDVSDACAPVTGNEHPRAISFKITKAGKTSGVVSSTEEEPFTGCVSEVPVKIQRKKSGAWKTVGTTTTDDQGNYTKKVKNPKGTQKFRALAPKVSLGDPVTDVCLKARSAVRKK
jgi:IPT/TIG domain